MTDTCGKFVPREPRFYFRCPLEVLLRREGEPPTVASMIDLSRQGARFHATQPLPSGEFFQIACHSLQFEFSVAAKVCWKEPAKEGGWLLGSRLKPPIPEAVFDRLLQAGQLNRRTNERDEVSIAATAQWEMETEPVDCRVVNLSSGGVCIEGHHCGQAGARLRLRWDGDTVKPVVVRALWLFQRAGSYIAGCEFCDHHGYAAAERRNLRTVPAVQTATPFWKRIFSV